MFMGIFRRMTDPQPPRSNRGRILFSVKEDPQFPAELWEQFKATARQRNQTPIAALRQLMQQYIAQEPTP